LSEDRCRHGRVVFTRNCETFRCFECEPLRSDEIDFDLLKNLTPCDECGIVFKDKDAYGEHLCGGRQGR
jgi:hypothetical protein